MNYKEKFKDPRWQKKRLEILQRDGFKCRECKSEDKTLNVHHIIYFEYCTDPWGYNDNFLTTLCDDCHDIEHEYDQKAIAFDLLKNLILVTNLPLSYFEIERDSYLMENELIGNQGKNIHGYEIIKKVFKNYIDGNR